MSRTRAQHTSRPARAWRASALVLSLAVVIAPVASLAHPGMHETIEYLTQQIAAAPNDQRLYLERGNAYSNDGDVKSALADFRKAETLGDPELVAYDLGVLFYRAGDHAAAREQLTRSLARFPNDPRALDYRARAAREAGDARAALADLEALFALDANVSPGHYVSAAELARRIDGADVARALALLDLGMRRLGVIPQLQRHAIALERKRGRLAAALLRHEMLGDALAHGPEWRVDRAELLLALGRREEAGRELSAADADLAALKPTPARAALAARSAALAQDVRSSRAAESGAREKP